MAWRAMRDILGTALLLAALVPTMPASALDPGQPVVVTPIDSTSVTAAGQPIMLPQANAHVIVSQFDIAPGATLPVHKHPYPRYGYMLAGELEVTNVETGASTTYKAGDFIVEMIGLWHQGSNIGTVPARLIVIDQVEGDAGNTILKE